MELLRRGDRGPAVAEIKAKLVQLGLLAPPATGAPNLSQRDEPDAPGAPGAFPAADNDADAAEFDEPTDRAVRGFQQARGLRADGIVGPQTYRCLEEAHWRLGDRVLSFAVSRPIVGDDVAALQQRLLDLGFDPGRADGIFGRATDTALREFQRNVGLHPDGTLGPGTLRALDQLRRTVTGGSPSERREEERLHRSGASLAGRIVVIDPAHGGDETGVVGGGVVEAEITWDLATRIEGRLGALGVTTYLTRSADTCPADAERARFANDVDADIVISLHLDAHHSPDANGAASFFFGVTDPGRAARSAVGERLADLLLREVTSRTDLVDARSHPKTWELLRMTRMPAVRLEAGYVSNAGDAARLAEPEFRDALAEAVAASLQRLYLPEHLDIPTGQFRIAALTG